MPLLPPVVVELKASADQFMAKMGEARAEMHKVGKEGGDAFAQFSAIGQGALLGLAAATASVGAVALHMADQYEIAHATLEAALKNSGTSFEQYKSQIGKAEKAFENLGFSQAQYETGLARMVAITHNVAASMGQMNLVADLARAKNISLEESATAVARVMEGTGARALKMWGITASNTGNAAVDAARNIDALTHAVGGTAQAQAETFAGQMAALKAKTEDLAAAFGMVLIPWIERVAAAAGAAAQFFKDHERAAGLLAGIVGGVLVGAMTAYLVTQARVMAGSLAAAFSQVATTITGLLVPAVEAATVAEGGLAVAEAGATGGLSLLLPAVFAVGGAVASLFVAHKSAADSAAAQTAATKDLGNAESTAADFTDKLTESTKALDNLYKKLTGDTEAMSAEVLKLLGDQNRADETQKKLTDSVKKHSHELAWATTHTKELVSANKALVTAQDQATAAIDRQTAAHKKLDELLKPQPQRSITDATNAHAAASDRLIRAHVDQTAKAKALQDAIDKYGASSTEAMLAQLDLNDASRAVTQAEEDQVSTGEYLQAANRDTVGTVDEITQAQKDAKTADDHAKDAIGGVADAREHLNSVLADRSKVQAAAEDAKAIADNTLAAAGAALTLKTDWETMTGVLAAHPDLSPQFLETIKGLKGQFPTLGDIKPLSDIMDKISNFKPPAAFGGPRMQITGPAPGPGPAGTLGDTVNEVINTVLGNTIGGVVTSVLGALGQSPLAHQFGGPITAGRPYLVGEVGPELMIPGQSGTLIPHDRLGGTVVNVYVAGSVTTETDLAEVVRGVLLRAGRGTVSVGLG